MAAAGGTRWSGAPLSDRLCECGCGQRTRQAPQSSTRDGLVKGEGVRFAPGHRARRGRRKQYDVKIGPLALCSCGCGAPVLRVGARWLPGHFGRRTSIDYVVDDAGCWVWQRKVTSKGYGIVGDGAGGEIHAHRSVWLRERGPLEPGQHLHHECENRRCVNPDHLVPLTHAEHMALHAKLRRAA